MIIKISDLTGPNCISYSDGLRIYDLLHSSLQKDSSVELDFEGVRVLVSVFLNAAIGRLLEDYSVEDLNRTLRISNLPAGGEETLRRVIETSNDYYHHPQVREALDKILTERVAEV